MPSDEGKATEKQSGKQTNRSDRGKKRPPDRKKYSLDEIEKERVRLRRSSNAAQGIRNLLYTLVILAAASFLIISRFLPVLHIYGKSMEPALKEGEIVLTVKESTLHQGDIIGFYYRNKILIKRITAVAGQMVDMQSDGTVLVDGSALEETYITEKSLGDVDIEFPFLVPEGEYFVLGDNRSISADSRSTDVGTVSEDQLVGKVILRVWPLKSLARFG